MIMIISFYSTLHQIFQNAEIDNWLLEFDANAKVGPNVIFGDPNQQWPHGRKLMDMVERNNLIICNSSDRLKRLITQQRQVNQHFWLLDYPWRDMQLSRKYDVTNVHARYIKRKNGVSVIQSDHYTIFGTFNLKRSSREKTDKKRGTIFNYLAQVKSSTPKDFSS